MRFSNTESTPEIGSQAFRPARMDINRQTAEPSLASIFTDDFEHVLLVLASAASRGEEFLPLVQLFLPLTLQYFGVTGVSCWLLRGEELVALSAEGANAEQFDGARLKLSQRSVAVDAVLSGRTVFVNDMPAHPEFSFAMELPSQAILSAPLIVYGEVKGVITLVQNDPGRDFHDGVANKATILALQLGSFLESARLTRISSEEQHRAEDLMSMALELSSSIRLPELVQSFTRRAADMLHAESAALALTRATQLETVFLHNPQHPEDKAVLRSLNKVLTDLAAEKREEPIAGSAVDLLGPSLAAALGWRDVVIARLINPETDLIGMICLANRGVIFTAADRNLLQALAGHASVALDNSRLFSRVAQANSQWIEIFDAISDFIVVHDESNRVLRINRSMAEFIGVRPSELIGVSMRAVMALAQEAGPEPCPFCRNEGQDEFIHPVLERTYLVSSSMIRGTLDEGMQTIHVLKDITDRREAERRYRELFDNIQEGLFFSTPDGRFIEVNDALVRMLGYDSRDELLQADIARQLYGAPGQRTGFQKEIEEHGTLRNFEETLRRKDGSIIYSLQNAFAVRDAHGKIIQYRGVMLDITELKTFQAELQRQRDFNAKILNNTQSLIMVSDTAGLISYANRRCYEAGSFKPGELVGRQLALLIAENRRHAFEEALALTIDGQQVDNLELPLTQGSQQLGQFSVNLSPMRDEQGQVTSIVVVMTDITDSAVLQAKLMHTEKMAAVGQLVSGVAHEVNNPLTAILGFADLLVEQDDIPEAAKRDLAVIINEAQRTKQIVQNLLSFARQMPARRQPVQVNAILNRTLQLRAYDLANHGVEVLERFTEPLPDVVGDSQQLQQVFLNILNNAYDAVRESGQPGSIEIQTLAVNGQIEVVFTDNGPGIKAPERIFDPFFTTKEVGKGTGLGLSICYGIVREHGGEINCRNRTEGKGAVFTVRLPLAAAPALAKSKGAP